MNHIGRDDRVVGPQFKALGFGGSIEIKQPELHKGIGLAKSRLARLQKALGHIGEVIHQPIGQGRHGR